MRLIQIEVSNFKSFVEKTVFEVSSNHGIYLVNGDNGSGKTSLLVDALVWCFFGKTSKSVKSPGVVSWISGKDETTSVTVIFKLIENGRDYTVTRTVNPNNLFMSTVKESEPKKVTQNGLETVLGISYDLFLNSCVFDQTSSKFLDVKQSDRSKLFSEMLDLESFDDYISNSVNKLENVRKTVNSVKSNLDSKKTALKVVKEQISYSTVESENWRDHSKRDFEDRLKELSGERVGIIGERASTTSKIKGLTRSLNVKFKEKKRLTSKISKAANYLNLLDLDSMVLKTEIQSFEETKLNLISLSGSYCPICKREIDTNFAKELCGEVKE